MPASGQPGCPPVLSHRLRCAVGGIREQSYLSGTLRSSTFAASAIRPIDIERAVADTDAPAMIPPMYQQSVVRWFKATADVHNLVPV